MDVSLANATAVARMIASRPMLTGVARAGESIPGMHERLLLHAGPPIEWDRMSGPLRGAVVGALLYEGIASDEEEAVGMAASGAIEFAPCHDHSAVGPMAGVISSSMAVYVIEDLTHGHRTYRLRWMNEAMAPALAKGLAGSKGIDIRALLSEALHMGDEGHNRNKAGSLLFLKLLAPMVASLELDPAEATKVLAFIGDNALSVLNPVMAACKAMADAAHGVDGSTVVTAMARNGTDFGIRVSGLADRWFTAPAQTPDGLYFAGFSSADANPDIGDSTITETAGIGAFAMAAAPAIVTFVSGTPRDAIDATLEMYEITVAEHEHFTIPTLDFRGTPTGIDLRSVVELGVTPRVNTGIAHREAGVGQVGAGLVRPPLEIFEQALLAFAERYGI